jgi:ankyrin repeat protein
MSPLESAVANNRVDMIRMLVSAGADLESRGELMVEWTALQRAIGSRHMEAVEELLRARANVNAEPSKKPDLFFQVKTEYEWPLLDTDEARPLYLAACLSWPEMVELLLNHGADINALSFGWSALHAAAAKADTQMVELLLRRGAGPYVKSDVKSPFGDEYNHRTPIDLLEGLRRSGESLRRGR